MNEPRAHADDLARFITASPSPYHTAAEVARRLTQAGFAPQREDEPWDASPGGHFVVRDGAVIAYRVPDELGDQPELRVVGAHTDSPGFKLKPNPDHLYEGWLQAGVEVYGGPILASWLDRDLALAGRVVLPDQEVRLVASGPALRIPSLAIHLDRGANESLRLDRQRHLLPVWGLARTSGGGVLDAVASLIGARREDVLGHDLFLAPSEAPGYLGRSEELFASWRLDNLVSVHAGLVALAGASLPDGRIDVLACFDHEEIGSKSREGAEGTFLEDVLRRLAAALGATGDAWHRMLARSWVVSADVGHGVHPNYPEAHDPDARPRLGGGPLLKVNASQRYTTQGPGTAMWAQTCASADVPWQVFVSNNSMPCGSTIGPAMAARLGIRSIDVGVGLLSMHSARELCATDDPAHLASALTQFFS